jgi:hypothetical protein
MSAMTAQQTTRKRYSLFVLAILLLLLSGVALFLGAHNFAIRAVGLVGCIVSVYLIRMSKVHAGPTTAIAADQHADAKAKNRPGRPIWIVGVALLLLAGGSLLYLYQDALHGYHEALPVYLFAGVGLTCTVVWSYLISKILSGGRKQGS